MVNVEIYTTPSCRWCEKTKKFLKGKKIEFKEHDVSKNEKARKEMTERSGQMGVPVLNINETIIVGYNPKEIEKALEKK